MIDQKFQAAITRLNTRSSTLATSKAFLFGLMAAIVIVALAAISRAAWLDPAISEEDLGGLTALAACSTGQSPAVEWQQAQDRVSMMDRILGRSHLPIIRYFLSVIDTDRCGGPQPLRAKHYQRV